jgi:hypothetical protein
MPDKTTEIDRYLREYFGENSAPDHHCENCSACRKRKPPPKKLPTQFRAKKTRTYEEVLLDARSVHQQ